MLWCSIVFSFFALRLLLPEQPAWKRFLLLLLVGVFWTSWDGRTALGILCFAAFLRGWYRLRAGRLQPVAFAVASALFTALAFWYSADTGVYSVAAFLLAFGGVALEDSAHAAKLETIRTSAGGVRRMFRVLVFVINTIIAGPLDFRFWQTSLALVSVHRWNEPAPMTEEAQCVYCCPLRLARRCSCFDSSPRRNEYGLRGAAGFLIGAYIFSLLAMQSGLVRSDSNHIVFGVFPMLFFGGVILFSFRSRLGSAAAALGQWRRRCCWSIRCRSFSRTGCVFGSPATVHPMTTCPSGNREVDQACFPTDFANTLESTAAYIRQHSGDGQAVLIYPYQYMFAVAARRDEAGAVEQTFLANGAYLSQFDIAGMERANAPVGLYFRDATPREYREGMLSIPIDEVSNFTRTPDVWFWVLRNYRTDQPIAPGAVALVRDSARKASISMKELSLGIPARTYAIEQPDAAIDLGAPAWPNADADFLRLRMKVRYGPLWKLRKPERVQLEITRADGSRSLRTFVIEPTSRRMFGSIHGTMPTLCAISIRMRAGGARHRGPR